ncbi:MAG TPA: DNA methyltransferase, partial [Humisphaera sp.]|nr:DNA methyltransferase [Humisphaera sp.]
HDQLEAGGFTGSDLERLLVRLLFCLFAEDTEVFEPNTFTTFLREYTVEDGSDLGGQLNELFDRLNTPKEKWPAANLEKYANFKYVNGRLFADRLGYPAFTRPMRDALLDAAEYAWQKVSPAVFGSLFQGIKNPKERRQQGAHYTSERDILKVIRSLFLDDLRGEFDAIAADRSTRRIARLQEFQKKLRSLRFLDPACGCGNFLVLSYRELRLLELELLRELHASGQQLLNVRELIQVDVDQFHGIELDEWAARIAEVAMWLMDHQMNQRVSEAFGLTFERLPLGATPHIVHGNALRMDWRETLPPTEGVYILGNPPFVGSKFQSPDQRADMELAAAGCDNCGLLDYVTGWYFKAARYIEGTRITVAFVSTNSITQGEQVGPLWNRMLHVYGIRLHFAHRTFAWMSEARGKAHVHVVIIGFGTFDGGSHRIYDYGADVDHPLVSVARNINPYLTDGPDVVVSSAGAPKCDVPRLAIGNKPIDDGNYLFTPAEKSAFVLREPGSKKWFRRWVGSVEFINGIERWCLWLGNVPPDELRRLPECLKRIAAVRTFRLASKSAPTRRIAATPTRFHVENFPTRRYLVIPKVSSERRVYIPVGFLSPDVLSSDLLHVMQNASIYHFGVMTSAMHMAWTRSICGRLKSDFRYSASLVYNNFPWPTNADDKRKSAVEKTAQAVLDARRPFLPPQGDGTLADLYDPLTMPAVLAKAHADLDRAVDRCYRAEAFKSDRERFEHLFARYEALTAPLIPAVPKKRKSAIVGKANKKARP